MPNVPIPSVFVNSLNVDGYIAVVGVISALAALGLTSTVPASSFNPSCCFHARNQRVSLLVLPAARASVGQHASPILRVYQLSMNIGPRTWPLIHVVEDVLKPNPPFGGGGSTQSASFVAAIDGGYLRTEVI